MAIKTFTTGEVLTAADTNTYLANSGLVYLTTTTIGSGVSSVTVSSIFSSTYDNYKIVFTGSTPSAEDSWNLRLGSTTTGYYGALPYFQFTGATGVLTNNNSGKAFISLNQINSPNNSVILEIISPNLARNTLYSGQWVARGYSGTSGGYVGDNTQYTAFTILNDGAGTFTGGTITVYGYRKA